MVSISLKILQNSEIIKHKTFSWLMDEGLDQSWNLRVNWGGQLHPVDDPFPYEICPEVWCLGYVFGVQIPNLRRRPWMFRVRLWRYLLARKPNQNHQNAIHTDSRCVWWTCSHLKSKKWHNWLDSLRPRGIIFSTNCIANPFSHSRLKSTLNLLPPKLIQYICWKMLLGRLFSF